MGFFAMSGWVSATAEKQRRRENEPEWFHGGESANRGLAENREGAAQAAGYCRMMTVPVPIMPGVPLAGRWGGWRVCIQEPPYCL